jgi:alkanesulfonate monooxygenase SsuD/methylene tetrahydromethanopterin reductase-like flavin-dependent oxidoreductase (luciferase family)
MWNGFGDVATIRHKLEVLRLRCEEIGRDPAEIWTTRLGTALVAPTMEGAKRRRDAWQAEKGIDDEAVEMRLAWGDPETVAAKAREFLDAGLKGLILNMPSGSSPDDVSLAGRALSAAIRST